MLDPKAETGCCSGTWRVLRSVNDSGGIERLTVGFHQGQPGAKAARAVDGSADTLASRQQAVTPASLTAPDRDGLAPTVRQRDNLLEIAGGRAAPFAQDFTNGQEIEVTDIRIRRGRDWDGFLEPPVWIAEPIDHSLRHAAGWANPQEAADNWRKRHGPARVVELRDAD